MDTFDLHLNAAAGFLDLRMPTEAWAELDRVEPPQRRAGPTVLALRLDALLDLERWPAAAEVARHLASVQPAEPGWPLALAYAVRRAEGTPAALAIVQRAAGRFPGVAAYPYALACYAGHAGELAAARGFWEEAFTLNPDLRLDALAEPDLKACWEELGTLPNDAERGTG